MKKIFKVGTLAFGLIPIASGIGCGTPQSSKSELVYNSELTAQENITNYIENEIEKGFPSAQLYVSQHGKTLFNSSFGYANKFAGQGEILPKQDWDITTIRTIYDQASNTKMYATNIALMYLVSNELIDVDQKVKTYIPEYTGGGRDNVTVRQVLTHTAGYAPEVIFYNEKKLGENVTNTIGEDMPKVTLSDQDLFSYSDNADLYSTHMSIDQKNSIKNTDINHGDPSSKTKAIIINKVPLTYQAGTKNIYSDTDFMLLGIIIERVVNKALSGKKMTANGEVDITPMFSEALNRNNRLYPDVYKKQTTEVALDEFVEAYIYQPLQMTRTMFNPLLKGIALDELASTEIRGNSRDGLRTMPGLRTNVIRGQVHDEKAWYSMGGVAGHAGLFSTAEDTAKIQQLILKKGKYIDNKGVEQEMINQKTISLFTDRDHLNPTYGLGWRRLNGDTGRWMFGDYASQDVLGHSGWTGTITVIDPKYDLTITFFTNKKHSHVMSKLVQEEKGYKFSDSRFEFDKSNLGYYQHINTFIYQSLGITGDQ